jgi:hypothetical protein
MQSHARLESDKAARYMTQLAQYWGRRFEVSYDDISALIPLPCGTCSMMVDPDGLAITLEAFDGEGLTRLEDVVADHLRRFAASELAGESRGGLAWTRAWEAGWIDPPTLRINRVSAAWR